MQRMVMVAVLLLIGWARGDEDRAAAREAYREGTRFYDLHQYPEALSAFRRAYLKFEEPVLLFNIAQCERALGDKESALQSYRSYLRKLPDAENRADVERIVEGLDAAIQKEKAAQQLPPSETIHEAAQPSPLPLTVAPPEKKPLYKKWWLWTAVGGAVVVAGAITLGVTLGSHSNGSSRLATVEGN